MASVGLHCVMLSSPLSVSAPSSSERVHSSSPCPPRALKSNFSGEAVRGSLNAAGGHLHVPAPKINEASFSAVMSIRMAQSAQEVKTASQSSGQTKMVVSIAGATGFVGSRLVEKLVG